MSRTSQKSNFKTDLETKGKPGEAEFKRSFPITLIQLSGFGADFLCSDGTTTIEIKTDFNKWNSPNFFMERYSSVSKESPGGPFQSDMKGVEYFIYWFWETREYYIFETAELVHFLNKYIETKKPKLKEVMNDGYVTVGYAIPRSALKHLGRVISDCDLVDKPDTLTCGYKFEETKKTKSSVA